jgi:hypothetical protein
MAGRVADVRLLARLTLESLPRLSECLALRRDDIGSTYLTIVRSNRGALDKCHSRPNCAPIYWPTAMRPVMCSAWEKRASRQRRGRQCGVRAVSGRAEAARRQSSHVQTHRRDGHGCQWCLIARGANDWRLDIVANGRLETTLFS